MRNLLRLKYSMFRCAFAKPATAQAAFGLVEMIVVGTIMSLVGLASMQMLKSNLNAVKVTSEIATKNMNFANLVNAASSSENLKISALAAVRDPFNRMLSKCYAASSEVDCIVQKNRSYNIDDGSTPSLETMKENSLLLKEGYVPFALYVKDGATARPLSGANSTYTKAGKLCSPGEKDSDARCVLRAETYFLPNCAMGTLACEVATNFQVVVRLYQFKKDSGGGNLDLGDKRTSSSNPLLVAIQNSISSPSGSYSPAPKTSQKGRCESGTVMVGFNEKNEILCEPVFGTQNTFYVEGKPCYGATNSKNKAGCGSPTKDFTCCLPNQAAKPSCSGLAQVGMFIDRFGDWGRDLRWVAVCKK